MSVNRLRFERDNVVNMTHEVERLEKVCSEEDTEIDNLEHVLKILERYVGNPFVYTLVILSGLDYRTLKYKVNGVFNVDK